MFQRQFFSWVCTVKSAKKLANRATQPNESQSSSFGVHLWSLTLSKVQEIKLANRDTQPSQLQPVPVYKSLQLKTTTVDEQKVDLEKNVAARLMTTSSELRKTFQATFNKNFTIKMKAMFTVLFGLIHTRFP